VLETKITRRGGSVPDFSASSRFADENARATDPTSARIASSTRVTISRATTVPAPVTVSAHGDGDD
jgi:hypothetical protein